MKKYIGYMVLSFGILLGAAMVAFPAAVTQLAGLAVAQSSTQWNNVKDFAFGDALTNGSLMSTPCLYNGTTCDRQRGSIANGAFVEVKAFAGGVTPADGTATPTNAINATSYPELFNGSTSDRERAISASNNTATTSLGVQYSTPLTTWTVRDLDAGATQSTASKAAGGGTVRHVATGALVCRGDTAVAAPAQVHLRDGATGAGTILMSWVIGVSVANESVCVPITGLNITGSANTAMTLEFAAAGSATSTSTVTLAGYSTP
jgi:hypothetical protein